MEKSPIDKLIQPVNRFIHLEYTSGIVLFLGVVVALIWVNSPFSPSYHHLWNIEFSFGFGGLMPSLSKRSISPVTSSGMLTLFQVSP